MYEAQVRVPQVMDITELPLRSVVLIGLRSNNNEWQEAQDAFGKLVDAKDNRVFRVTKTAKHLVGLLRNGIVMPKETVINDVSRGDHWDAMFHSLYLLKKTANTRSAAYDKRIRQDGGQDRAFKNMGRCRQE